MIRAIRTLYWGVWSSICVKWLSKYNRKYALAPGLRQYTSHKDCSYSLSWNDYCWGWATLIDGSGSQEEWVKGHCVMCTMYRGKITAGDLMKGGQPILEKHFESRNWDKVFSFLANNKGLIEEVITFLGTSIDDCFPGNHSCLEVEDDLFGNYIAVDVSVPETREEIERMVERARSSSLFRHFSCKSRIRICVETQT